jgi:large subunit ribosomal protein L9
MPMQLILTDDVEHLGKAGDLVTVKPGYGRNYLLPKRKAVSATSRNIAELEHKRHEIASRIAKARGAAEDVAGRINGMTLQFERVVGDEDKMFGSVTTRDIAEQLARAKVRVDHRKIQLSEPIRALGKYDVPVKIHGEVEAKLKFWVVGKEK